LSGEGLDLYTTLAGSEGKHRSRWGEKKMTNGTERPGGYGITALVLGIVGVALGWWIVPFLGFISSILAIVFGALGIKSRTRGMAIAGLVLGIVTIVLSIVGMLLWGAMMSELL